MTDDDRRSILDQLHETLAALERELDGLTGDQLTHRSAPGAWSILDCVEHLAAAEDHMLGAIAQRSKPVAVPIESREQRYYRGSLNRSRKFSAPPGMEPVQRHASVEQALSAFEEVRRRTVDYIEQTTDDLRARSTVHPVAGEITCRECLALLIGHPVRHLEQIRDIKASPAYPAAAHLGTS